MPGNNRPHVAYQQETNEREGTIGIQIDEQVGTTSENQYFQNKFCPRKYWVGGRYAFGTKTCQSKKVYCYTEEKVYKLAQSE